MPSSKKQTIAFCADNEYVREEDIIQCLPTGFDVEKIVDQKKSTAGYEAYKVQLSKYVWIRKDLVANRHSLFQNFISKRLESAMSDEIEIVHDVITKETNNKDGKKGAVKKKYSLRNTVKQNGTPLISRRDDVSKLRTRRTKEIVCNVCRIEFFYDTEFDEHIRLIHDGINVNLQCHVCQKLLKDKNALKAHLVIHSDDSPFECQFCSKKFKLRKRVNEHIKTHHGTYSCTVCQITFDKLNDFKIHAAKEHPSKSPRLSSNFFACSECDSVFLNRSTLMNHLRSHSVVRNFQCPNCSKQFKHKKHLTAHIKHVCNKRNRLVCKICGKHYAHQSDYNMHIRTHDGTNPLYCASCDKYFLKQSLYLIHKASHTANKTGSRKRMSYHCDQCDKVFLDKRSFLLHDRVHYGKNPYKCAVCDHFFLKKSHLDKHNAWFHSHSARYSCRICGKAFRLRDVLLQHEVMHDKEKENGRQFHCISCDLRFLNQKDLSAHLKESIECFSVECDVCNRIFSTNKLLQRHKALHHDLTESNKSCLTGKFENHCSICNRTFQRKSKLLLHVRSVHEKIKDFSCPTCGKDFARRYDLKKHMEIHNRESTHGHLECLVCKQRGFTQEALELHQYSHMRIESAVKYLNEDQLLQMNRSLIHPVEERHILIEKDASLEDNDSLHCHSGLFVAPTDASFNIQEVITPRDVSRNLIENNACAVLVENMSRDEKQEFQINGKDLSGNLKLEFSDNGHIITISEVMTNNENGDVEVLTAFEDPSNGDNRSQDNEANSTQQIIYQTNPTSQAQIEYLSQIAAQYNNEVPHGYTQELAMHENGVEVYQITENKTGEDTINESDVSGLVIATVNEDSNEEVAKHPQEQYLQNVESLLLHANHINTSG